MCEGGKGQDFFLYMNKTFFNGYWINLPSCVVLSSWKCCIVGIVLNVDVDVMIHVDPRYCKCQLEWSLHVIVTIEASQCNGKLIKNHIPNSCDYGYYH
jgi:hypothetical protein